MTAGLARFISDIELKVKASVTAGAVFAAAAYLLGQYVYHGQVPGSIRALIDAAAPVIAGGITGWLAKHTPRPPAVSGPKSLADPALPTD